MSYNEQTEYPRGLAYSNAIGAAGAALTVSTANIMITHMIIRGGTAAGITLNFKNIAGTVTYRSFSLSVSTTVVFDQPWYADQGGLRVDTQPNGNADYTAIIFYVAL